jgi:hypothetical protein
VVAGCSYAAAVSEVPAARCEIHPKSDDGRRSVIAILGWTGFCMANVLAAHGTMRIVRVAIVVGGLVGTVALVHRWRRRALLAFSDDMLTYTGLFGIRVIARRPVSGRVVIATVQWTGSGRSSQRWLLLDAAGAARLGLDLALWDMGRLDLLTERLGIRREVDPTPRRPAELRRMYPGSVHWLVTHPVWLTIVLIAAVSLGLLALGATVD